MTRLFRVVEIVEGESVEPAQYVGVSLLQWQELIRGRTITIIPTVGFVEVDYTTEDVAEMVQEIYGFEAQFKAIWEIDND